MPYHDTVAPCSDVRFPEPSLGGLDATLPALVDDFTGDGLLDVVTTDRMGVVLGEQQPGGTFEIAQRVPLSEYGSLASGDLDGDQRPDLVIVEPAAQEILIGTNIGAGFTTTQLATMTNEPGGGAVVDLDHDGRLDIVVREYDSEIFDVYRNTATGLSTSPVTFTADSAVPLDSYWWLVDLDEDAIPDLLYTGCNFGTLPCTIGIQHGNGDGTFGAAMEIASFDARLITVADLDGDHHVDLLVESNDAAELDIFHGHGDGTFALGGRVSLPEPVTALAAGDINGDGSADLAYSFTYPGHMVVQLGTGPDTFGSPIDEGPGQVRNLVDINGDGKLDAVVGGRPSSSILLNDGHGALVTATTLPAANVPTAAVFADLDGDNVRDVATTTAGSFAIERAEADAFTFVTSASAGYGRSIAAGDLDGDGHPDLLVGNEGDCQISGHDQVCHSGTLEVALEPMQGAATPVSYTTAVDDATPSDPIASAAADIDGDGDTDVVVINGAETAQPFGTYDDIAVFLGRGDGTLQTATHISLGGRPRALALADLDGDQRPELIVTTEALGSVSVFANDGAGTFATSHTYPTGAGASALAVVDVDHDDTLDIVVANTTDSTLSVLLGRGDGTFADAVTLSVGRMPIAIGAGDLDGDGLPELVTANYQDYDLSILYNAGGGAFTGPYAYATGRSAIAVSVIDVDHDQRPDLVTVNAGDSTLTILHGRCGP
jgi:hypothetical protein